MWFVYCMHFTDDSTITMHNLKSIHNMSWQTFFWCDWVWGNILLPIDEQFKFFRMRQMTTKEGKKTDPNPPRTMFGINFLLIFNAFAYKLFHYVSIITVFGKEIDLCVDDSTKKFCKFDAIVCDWQLYRLTALVSLFFVVYFFFFATVINCKVAKTIRINSSMWCHRLIVFRIESYRINKLKVVQKRFRNGYNVLNETQIIWEEFFFHILFLFESMCHFSLPHHWPAYSIYTTNWSTQKLYRFS